MSASFPNSLDNLSNPSSTTLMDDPTLGHAAQHANLNDIVEAIEAKLGVDDSAVATTIDYRVKELETRKAPLASPSFTGTATAAALTVTGNAALGDAEATDTHAVKGATTVLANSSAAALTVTQTGTGNSFVVEDSASPDSTPVIIDPSGKLVIGRAAPVASLGITPTNQTLGTGLSTATVLSACFANDATSAGQMHLEKSRGAIGAFNVVQSGDNLGVIQFLGADGAAFIRGATITAAVDGIPGTNDMPGRLVFSTTADGAAVPTERMRISNAGVVTISNTTDSTSKDTGCLVVEGGIGVEKSVTAAQFKLSALNTAPTSATATGTLGEIRVAADYIYVCTATNTWVRAALATWT